jgi:hypothetical protein
MKPVGEPYAGNPHVRFDEQGWETERCRMAQATAPILDSTIAAQSRRSGTSAAGGSRRAAARVLVVAVQDDFHCDCLAAAWRAEGRRARA